MSDQAPRVLVIGMGEVGRRLAAALAAAGAEVMPVTRSSGWERLAGSGESLALVAVREEALPEVLPRLAGRDAAQLVFVQNGWIRPLLEGFSGSTRGLIWFTSKGEFFRELRPSIFGGPAAPLLAESLSRGGLAAVAVDERGLRSGEAEKMGFNCVVGLPLAVHRLPLGEYLTREVGEAEALFGESVSVTARALGVAADPGWWPDFLAAAASLAGITASAGKALEYRNGAVLRLARQLGAAVPVTERLLSRVGFVA